MSNINLLKNDIINISQKHNYKHLYELLSYIDARYIISLLDRELLEEDIKFLNQYQASTFFDNDLTSLILYMTAIARERSRGGCPLYKVFINKKNHEKLSAKYGGHQFTVARIPVLVEDNLTQDCDVYGFCKPKFELILPRYLIIKGKLYDSKPS